MGFQSTFLKSAINIDIFPMISKIGKVIQNHIFLKSGIGSMRRRSIKKIYIAVSIPFKYEFILQANVKAVKIIIALASV